MPVMEGYLYADTPHEKTKAGADYRYGCHSNKVGPLPRGRTSTVIVQDGWTEDGRRNMVPRTTEWAPKLCGHNFRSSDPGCEGCLNRAPDPLP